MAKIFDLIAPVYHLFYGWQYKSFAQSLEEAFYDLELNGYRNLIDVGSGTGALTAVFRDRGFQVTGVDLSQRMIQLARDRKENKNIVFVQADASGRLPFPDKSFDVAFTSFVAHGLPAPKRMKLYQELQRLAKHKVIILDYHHNNNVFVKLIEWAEGGDYVTFITVVESELMEVFGPMGKLKKSSWSSWYLCDPG